MLKPTKTVIPNPNFRYPTRNFFNKLVLPLGSGVVWKKSKKPVGGEKGVCLGFGCIRGVVYNLQILNKYLRDSKYIIPKSELNRIKRTPNYTKNVMKVKTANSLSVKEAKKWTESAEIKGLIFTKEGRVRRKSSLVRINKKHYPFWLIEAVMRKLKTCSITVDSIDISAADEIIDLIAVKAISGDLESVLSSLRG